LLWQPRWQWRKRRLLDRAEHPVGREREPPELEAADVEAPAAVVAAVDAVADERL
jgi:hypothetical protein